MRSLNVEGSLFVFGTFHNIGLINRIVQLKGLTIINEIIWLQRNSRPNVATRRLQASHHNILWIVKDSDQYRFNYRLCKRSDYDDWLSKRNHQARDVWDIRRTATRTPVGIRRRSRLLCSQGFWT